MRRAGTLFAAGWALALLWPGSGAAQIAPPPPSYLLQKVMAIGGNPIREVDGGVIFQQFGCSPGDTPVKPLAGSLGDDVSLVVNIQSCPGIAPAPTGECRLQVGTGAVATFPISGWEATLPVAMPAATGIYPLWLRCSFAGQPEVEIDTHLFVTYAKPVFPVSVPWEDWYRLACTWGAGLTAADPPAAGREKILHGLHDQGQSYWRYGYCTETSSLCIFGDTHLPIDSPDLMVRGNLGVCKWWLLAEGNPRCNFTDCFGYSDLFRYISGTMGMGVFSLPPVLGSKRLGFSTQGWLKALDPAAGNLDCGYRGLGCAFLFGSHSLVLGDGLFYDATFGQIYRGAGGLIAQNILSKEEGVVTLESSRACLLNRLPYGGFPVFRQIPLREERCPRDFNKPAVFVDPDADAVELESVEGDARPEVVTVRLTVNVEVAGVYQVYGALFGGPEGKTLVVSRPGRLAQSVFSTARISGLPGVYEVTLAFSGEDLVRSGVPPPYWVESAIVSDHGISDVVHFVLPEFSLAGLGEKHARLEGIATERRQAVQGAVLRVAVNVEVRTAGNYALAAYLFSGGRKVAEADLIRELSPGRETLVVDFPEVEKGLDGPYTVTFELHALDPGTGAPLEVVDALTQEVD